MHKVIFHQMMKNFKTKIINDFTQTKDLVLTVLSKQIFFEPYTRNEQIRQHIIKPTSHNNNFQHQNPVKNTQSYQPAQMQNKIPLPYYLQQHEITKSQLANFSQMPHAAEALQMTMNPYLMGGSSITSNKLLMVFTGTDPEYSVEDYLNAVTANLILNIGPEPINTHFIKIGYIDAHL